MPASRSILQQAVLRYIVALFVVCGVLFCARPAKAEEPRWGRLYVLSGIVSVRENPSDSALKVRVFKAGQKVRIDFQEDGWAAAFDPKEPSRSELKALGYVRLDELKAHGAPDPSQPMPLEGNKARAQAQAEAGIAKAEKPVKTEKAAKAIGKPAETNGAHAVAPAQAASTPQPEPKAEKPAKAVGKPADSIGAHAVAPAQAAPTPQPEQKNGKAGGKGLEKSAAKSSEKTLAKPEGLPAKGAGEIRVADRNLAVRGGRTTESEFKRLLRPGQRVRVDFWEDGWYAVFSPDEKQHDLSRAWGYSRDKFLVPEAAYAGPPAEAAASAKETDSPAVAVAGQKSKPAEDAAVGYSVLERTTEGRKPKVTTLRVRLDLAKPPAPEAMRKIAREIWKSERKKDENLQLEVLLAGMDAHGLAYATARFHDDGRVREFWWRDVVLGKQKK